jgi:tetratricopeptide (TPR) repeat protein
LREAPVFSERTSVGLDVHARSIVACGLDTVTGQVMRRRLVPSAEAVLVWLRELPAPVAVAYEAGPTGFDLARQLVAAGVRCVVAAPSKLRRPAGDRIKTDARDALLLARLLRMDEIVQVRVPSIEQEAARGAQAGAASQDPVAMATSARIMTHALMSNGHTKQARSLAENAAGALERDTRLTSADQVAVYGALLLRGAIAAARSDDRDSAQAMIDEATRAAARLGYDGNDRWTGFGATNVLLHQVNIALTLGDAGTAIALARQVPLDKIRLAERKASLFVDVARAYTQWGRYEHGLNALRIAYEVAPEELRCRPAVQRIAGDLAALSRGHVRTAVVEFAHHVGIPV